MRNSLLSLFLLFVFVVMTGCKSKQSVIHDYSVDVEDSRVCNADSLWAELMRRTGRVKDLNIVLDVVAYDTSVTDSCGNHPVKGKAHAEMGLHEEEESQDGVTMQGVSQACEERHHENAMEEVTRREGSSLFNRFAWTAIAMLVVGVVVNCITSKEKIREKGK